MSPSTRLLLLRHGEVEQRYHHVFGGRIDMELSARGHEQAAALARYLETERMDALYASPMRRVQQTLAPLASQRSRPATVIPELREVDFGAWTGLHAEEVRTRYGANPSDWTRLLEEDAIPEAESAARLRARLEPCVQQILQPHSGETVAVLCHGGVIRMMLAILLSVPFRTMGLVGVEYASVTIVEVAPARTRLQLLNFTPWRDLR